MADRLVGVALDAVVTHHRDGFRSGVARFNELLADRMGMPLLGLDELSAARPARALLSFKLGEVDRAAAGALDLWLATGPAYEVFLHDFGGSEAERALVAGAERVRSGNAAIADAVASIARSVDVLWTPGLLLDDRVFRPAEISIFSFGMAHKLRTDMFRRLRELLDSSGRSYVVYVSAANHETASLRDSAVVFEEMQELFPRELYFLGNLSDVAVVNYLDTTTFYAAFFPDGVRANNTSVASALERGAVVITNLDGYSPSELVHGENVLDLGRLDELPVDPLVLKRISAAAIETGRARGWDQLVERLR